MNANGVATTKIRLHIQFSLTACAGSTVTGQAKSGATITSLLYNHISPIKTTGAGKSIR